MMVKVFGGASSNVTRSSLFRGNLEMQGDDEQEIAGVSVSLPGSLTLAGVFLAAENCARARTYIRA